MTTEREAFEKWAREATRWSVLDWNEEYYSNATLDLAWCSWQAARAQPAWASERWTLADLHRANAARQEEWCPDQKPDLSFRGNELAGEVGEACNVIKKLERERLGWAGSRDTVEHLAEELADGIMCIDLAANAAGISGEDLMSAIVQKFNSVSKARGFKTMLSAAPPPPSEEAAKAEHTETRRCEDCPPIGYPTDRTRCIPCDRRLPDDGTCVRCGSAPRNASGLCATCVDEDAVRAGETEDELAQSLWRETLDKEYVYPALSEPAPAMRVKRLVWVKHPTARAWWAETFIGRYEVSAILAPRWQFTGYIEIKDAISSGSADEAKAAAQADYECRVLSALEPAPAQEPRGCPTPGACSCGQPAADEEPVEWAVDVAWQDLIEKTDRTSPKEYPDHALITRDELAGYMAVRRPSDAFKSGARAMQEACFAAAEDCDGPYACATQEQDEAAWLMAERIAAVISHLPLPEDKEG